MKKKKGQWLFGFFMVALMVISALSMPALAEEMIASEENNVQVDESGELRKRVYTTDASKTEIKAYPLSSEAYSVLEAYGRKAFLDIFALEIPAGYKPAGLDAYESDGSIVYNLSLMPPDWEEGMDVMQATEAKPFYTAQFGDVNVETGDAALTGLQQWTLGTLDANPAPEANYTDAQIAQMEEQARAFAAGLNFNVLGVIGVDKVSGSYPKGCILMFSMGGEKTLSVTVSERGGVSGYSLVPGKG